MHFKVDFTFILIFQTGNVLPAIKLDNKNIFIGDFLIFIFDFEMFYQLVAEMYFGPCQTSMMELFSDMRVLRGWHGRFCLKNIFTETA